MRVVVAARLAPTALADLEKLAAVDVFPSGTPPRDALRSADALVVRGHIRVDAALLDLAPRLRLVVKAGAGTDTLDLPELRHRGVAVVTVPSPESVAEHAMLLLLAVRRRLVPLVDAVREGRAEAKYELTGNRLAGSTFGVVGFGAIGAATARLAAGFRMRVLVCDRSAAAKLEKIAALDAEVVGMDELFDRADHASLHVPLTASTRGFVGAVELGMLGPAGVLINTSRGAVVDEGALVQALATGALGGAGLDVVGDEPVRKDNPLLAAPNVVVTPHVGSQTVETLRDVGTGVVEAVRSLV